MWAGPSADGSPLFEEHERFLYNALCPDLHGIWMCGGEFLLGR
jgi:hypothetical protein